jgi:hypothetical protein
VRGATGFAPWGILAGACFAIALIAIARSRTGWRAVDALPSPGRAAAWGAGAAILLPLAAATAASLGILPGHTAAYWFSARLLVTAATAGGALAAALVAVGRKPLRAQLAGPQALPLPHER